MTSAERKNLIALKLSKAFITSYLEVVDESHQHINHAGYQGGGRHFAIIIQSDQLTHLSRIEAHRKIYHVLSDMIPNEIHALRIKVIE